MRDYESLLTKELMGNLREDVLRLEGRIAADPVIVAPTQVLVEPFLRLLLPLCVTCGDRPLLVALVVLDNVSLLLEKSFHSSREDVVALRSMKVVDNLLGPRLVTTVHRILVRFPTFGEQRAAVRACKPLGFHRLDGSVVSILLRSNPLLLSTKFPSFLILDLLLLQSFGQLEALEENRQLTVARLLVGHLVVVKPMVLEQLLQEFLKDHGLKMRGHIQVDDEVFPLFLVFLPDLLLRRIHFIPDIKSPSHAGSGRKTVPAVPL